MPLILQPLPGYYIDNLSDSDNANSMCCTYAAQQRKIVNLKNSDKRETTLSTLLDLSCFFSKSDIMQHQIILQKSVTHSCGKVQYFEYK